MIDALEEAAAFLRDLLGPGPKLVSEVQRLAEEGGIGWRTLRRASDLMAIRKRPGVSDRKWYWSLRDSDANDLDNLANMPVQEPRRRAAVRAPTPADVLREWRVYLLSRQVAIPAKVLRRG